MKKILKNFGIQLILFLFLISSFGIIYAAWNDTVNSGDPLTAESWNEVVDRLEEIDGNISFSGGRVGIGTDIPSANLEVLGSAKFGDQNANSGTIRLNAENFAWYGWYLKNQRTGFIQSTASNFQIYSQTPGVPISFYTSGSNRMSITGSGSVGIGTNNPNAKLHVNGDIKVGNTGESCDGTKEGAIRYNGTSHQGCDGTTWNNLY